MDEVLHWLPSRKKGIALDSTLGGGGHAEALLKRDPDLRLIGLDKDVEAITRSHKRLKQFEDRVDLVNSGFEELDQVLDDLEINCVDLVIMDVGVSSFHLNEPKRGFSFSQNGLLDMRFDTSVGTNASDIIARSNERELASIFTRYGEQSQALKVAKAIIKERAKSPIKTTVQLSKIVESVLPRKRRGAIHPSTKVFQALRIAVNDELDALSKGLKLAAERLCMGGRMAVISFHSLEDRIVKRTMRNLEPHCVCPKESPICVCNNPGYMKILTKKPIRPKQPEVETNPRSRSAKLRVAERIKV
ncbi:MAG: 16S rRNA (cytosine(1402)-N(4))-methyltransferase [Anaerolineaceae bacterium]|nr:16S rRNA (cytosine(1402)-N(4))-methyltransferase [Anaerolineaceae bacterium]|tara:strand:- start:21828 stop:22736 length:909 start_codon:yes stop_codon:yes gene_type:complete